MDVGDAKLTVKVGNFNFWDYVLFVQWVQFIWKILRDVFALMAIILMEKLILVKKVHLLLQIARLELFMILRIVNVAVAHLAVYLVYQSINV